MIQKKHSVIPVPERKPNPQSMLDGVFMRLGSTTPMGTTPMLRNLGIRFYQRRVAQNPYDPNGYYFLGNLYMWQGRYADSAQAYRRVVELVPDHVTSYGNLGFAYIQLQRFEEARDALESAVCLRPDHPPTLYNLGYVYGSLKNFHESVGACVRALLLNPDHDGALFLAGYGYLKIGNYSEAANHFTRYLTLRPDHQAAHHYLGLACIKLGRIAEAAEAIQKAGLLHKPSDENPEQATETPEPSRSEKQEKKGWGFQASRSLGKVLHLHEEQSARLG